MSCIILSDVKYGLNHIVYVNALYPVWVKESRALLHVPDPSQRVQGTLYIYQDTLHTAQDVPSLNKQSRALLNCTRSMSNSPRPMVPVTLVHYSMGNAILSHNSFSHLSYVCANNVPANLGWETIRMVLPRPQISHIGQFHSTGPTRIGEYDGQTW